MVQGVDLVISRSPADQKHLLDVCHFWQIIVTEPFLVCVDNNESKCSSKWFYYHMSKALRDINKQKKSNNKDNKSKNRKFKKKCTTTRFSSVPSDRLTYHLNKLILTKRHNI